MTDKNSTDEHGQDYLSAKDLAQIETESEQILDALYLKVQESQQARDWLNTKLGQALRKYLAADKLRWMKACAAERDPEKLEEAKFEYAVIARVESLIGSVIVGGDEAMAQLEQMNAGDTYED